MRPGFHIFYGIQWLIAQTLVFPAPRWPPFTVNCVNTMVFMPGINIRYWPLIVYLYIKVYFLTHENHYSQAFLLLCVAREEQCRSKGLLEIYAHLQAYVSQHGPFTGQQTIIIYCLANYFDNSYKICTRFLPLIVYLYINSGMQLTIRFGFSQWEMTNPANYYISASYTIQLFDCDVNFCINATIQASMFSLEFNG